MAIPTISEDDLLGVIVEPDIYGLKVHFDEVKRAADAAGIGRDVVKELSYKSAFSRACSTLKDNRTIDKLETMDNGCMVFQFTAKHEEDEEIHFNKEAKVYLDPITGDIRCAGRHDLEAKARELLSEAMDCRTTSDITGLIKNLLKEHADLYPTSRKGGSYFVPIAHIEYARKLERFVDECGSFTDKLRIFPVPKGTSEGNRNVRDSVGAVINSVLEEMDEAIDEWGENTKDKTIKGTMEKIEVLNYKIESLSMYLMEETEELQRKRAVLKNKLQTKVFGIAEGKAAPSEPEATEAEPAADSTSEDELQKLRESLFS